MFNFPPGVYSDVRIERRAETRFNWRGKKLIQNLSRDDTTAFVRVFDGRRWFFSGLSDSSKVQSELNMLAGLASSSNLRGNPVVDAFPVNTGRYGIPPSLPDDLVQRREMAENGLFLPDIDMESVFWTLCYEDRHITRQIYSSKGTNLTVDSGGAGYRYSFSLNNRGSTLNSDLMNFNSTFSDLFPCTDHLREHLEKCRRHSSSAVPLAKGNYTVILSPICAGLFAHESFGHKSEADFMTGHSSLIRKWPIGSKVASEILSVTDDGSSPGVGQIHVDDEGTLCSKTWLLRDGILAGRLHSVETASHFGEKPTGNARALNCQHEPIVRMTNTRVEPGETPVADLFAQVDDGVYVESIRTGTGLDRFTMNPDLAWRIRGGKIAEPVKITVLSGDVNTSLLEVDGVSETCEMFGSVDGGCGKFGQVGLRVGFGGPYVRVRKLEVI